MPEPADYSARYNTVLTPQEEALFQAWAAHANRQRDVFDYDLRGAWKADARAALNGHLPDTYKKPNHPTFSAESIYNGADGQQGGKWLKKGTRWEFQAGPANLSNLGPDGLRLYFKHVEPDSILLLPDKGF